MAAPIGNQNAAKSKQWTAAIERALDRLGDPDLDPDKLERTPRMKALDELAEKFITEVKTSGINGYKELADRLDGKAAQSIVGEDGGPLTVQIVRYANNSDTP